MNCYCGVGENSVCETLFIARMVTMRLFAWNDSESFLLVQEVYLPEKLAAVGLP